jgi:M6 family metalloprotease-like protein
MKIRKLFTSKSLLILLSIFVFSGCAKKKADSVFTNCKIPKAEGQAVSISGFPRNESRLPSTGNVNATVLFIDFPDKPATKTVAQAYALVSGATAVFTEQSYGRMNFVMSTPAMSWLRMSKASTDSSYSSNRFSVVSEAINLANPTVDFSSTDLVVVITDPDVTAFSVGPAFTSTRGINGITVDGKEITNFVNSGNDLNSWGAIWLNHEVTHTLGLVDLYRYGAVGAPGTKEFNLYDVGSFSYMGFNSFESNSPGLTAWERWVLGWLDDSQMTCVNPYTSGPVTSQITALHSNGGQKALVIPVNDTQVVVVETRRASGIDANIRKTGTLVYLVNSSVGSGSGSIKVFPKTGITDPFLLHAPRSVGESVTVAGIKVEVISSTSTEDTVTVSAGGIWIDY